MVKKKLKYITIIDNVKICKTRAPSIKRGLGGVSASINNLLLIENKFQTL